MTTAHPHGSSRGPLADVVVLDLTRMLPGAVLARMLLDLGARLVKIEAPGTGDPMRLAPPLVGGVGAGFAVYFRGAQSVTLDLRRTQDAAQLRHLATEADVLVESFRPGKLASWGLDPEALRRDNDRLITCSLPGFPPQRDASIRVGHDLNFAALSGVLSRFGDRPTVPRTQLADITTGMLACNAILAALFERTLTGSGRGLVQPLAAGPLPFVLWPWADSAAGARGMTDEVIAGTLPAYRLYSCADGRELAVGCLEPKFWASFCDCVGRPDLADHGLDAGPRGVAAGREMEAHLRSRPAQAWLADLRTADVPVTAVNDLQTAQHDPELAPLLEDVPMPDGTTLRVPGPAVFNPGLPPRQPAPTLGEHNALLLGAATVDNDGLSDPS